MAEMPADNKPAHQSRDAQTVDSDFGNAADERSSHSHNRPQSNRIAQNRIEHSRAEELSELESQEEESSIEIDSAGIGGGDISSIHSHPRVTQESQGAQRVVLPELPSGVTIAERSALALRMAQEAFAQTGYWVAFYKAILATGGVVSQLFPDSEELDQFYSTTEFAEIQKILTALRTSDLEKVDAIEPLKMLTIRIPRSMQSALMDEAKRNGTSINKLCISKLLCPIDSTLIPEEHGKVKGRKPQA